MRNAPKILIAIIAAGAIGGCHKSAPQPDANAIAADNNAKIPRVARFWFGGVHAAILAIAGN